MKRYTEEEIKGVLNQLINDAHETSVKKGWWDCTDADFIDEFINEIEVKILDDPSLEKLSLISKNLREQNKGEKISLMHSELSEALEALRMGNPPDDKCPEFDGCTVELADVLIRIFDFCGKYKFNLTDSLISKMKMNSTRSYKHGGKEF